MTISSKDIWFRFTPLEDGETVGDITFHSEGQHAGSITIGDQNFDFREHIAKRFAGGYLAQSPGQVQWQIVPVTLNSHTIHLQCWIGGEIGVAWYGIRPLLLIEGPSGDRLYFSFRPCGFGQNTWCRAVPALPYDLPLYRRLYLFSRLSGLACGLFVTLGVYGTIGLFAGFLAPAAKPLGPMLQKLWHSIPIEQIVRATLVRHE